MPKHPDDNTLAFESLERIERTLGRPVSDFFSPEGRMTREAEMLALMAAFERITDSRVRAKCIAFVIAEAVWEEHN